MICPPRVAPLPPGGRRRGSQAVPPSPQSPRECYRALDQKRWAGVRGPGFPSGLICPLPGGMWLRSGGSGRWWVKIRAGLGGGRMWLLYSSRAIFRLHVSRPGGWRGWLICLPTSHPIPESCPPSSISNCLGPELLRRFHLLEGSFGLGLPSSRQ